MFSILPESTLEQIVRSYIGHMLAFDNLEQSAPDPCNAIRIDYPNIFSNDKPLKKLSFLSFEKSYGSVGFVIRGLD